MCTAGDIRCGLKDMDKTSIWKLKETSSVDDACINSPLYPPRENSTHIGHPHHRPSDAL